MNTLENQHAPEEIKKTIDLSAAFQSMHPMEFLDHLRQYRKEHATLVVSVPWNNNENLGIRLKAFVESATETQKREASILGTAEERESALNLPHMANVLNSGVTWQISE